MKKHFIIATFAALAFFATACGKQDGAATDPSGGTTTERTAQNQQNYEAEEFGINIDFSEINPDIMQFVETHFPQTGIYNCHQTQHYYIVKLADQTKLKFTHTFDWVEVDCEHSTIYGVVPASIVPEQITAYISTNYPNNHIDQIEKKNNGNWEIELNNDREINFDANFNVINGGNNGGNNGGGNVSNYPEINTFVETYFPQTSIRNAHQDGNKIDVKLADGTDIDFYLNFDWQSIDCDESTIYGSVPAELVPTQITDYVTANFPDNHIDKIEKKNNGNWEIELNNNREIKFDANFNVISGGNNGGGNGGGGNGGGGNVSNYPEINTFVSTYFPLTNIQYARQDGNEIEVKLVDKTKIEFYLNFDWKQIDCEKGLVYVSVPTELVPAQITAYVNANFPGKAIETIEKKGNRGWEIELSNGLEIRFDSNFNVTEIDDKK